jgi:hypothetical protein
VRYIAHQYSRAALSITFVERKGYWRWKQEESIDIIIPPVEKGLSGSLSNIEYRLSSITKVCHLFVDAADFDSAERSS